MNEELLQRAFGHDRLPPGVFEFEPPLVLTAGHLRGAGSRTVLRPTRPVEKGAVVIRNLEHDEDTGLPRLVQLSDLRIDGWGPAALSYGLLIDGPRIRVSGIDVRNHYLGIAVDWAVDVTIRDALVTRNACNVYIPGSTAPRDATTTLRFEGCNLRESLGTGIYLSGGHGLLFSSCIVESNAAAGLAVIPRPGPVLERIMVRDTWFENNHGGHVQDLWGQTQFDNCRYT